jgi:3-deoxy-D-manno-octulosonic acid kinase
MANRPVLIDHGNSEYMVADHYAAEFAPEWFQPEYWGINAVPVGSGGRGGAWFLTGENRYWVLRRYFRGGLVSKLSRKNYIYTGQKRVRSFAEFHLLQAMHELGLPVPQPVAACYHRFSGFYQTAIIVERLAEVLPFGDLCTATDNNEIWRNIGRVIRRFHDAGVYHADLNCFNILVNGQAVYLIDFDKSRIIEGASDNAVWKHRNLNRLKRSLNKRVSSTQNPSIEHGWAVLRSAYMGSG